MKKIISKPSAVRGGRSKCLYELTDEGKQALKEIKDVQDAIWKGVSDVAFD